MYFPDFSFFSYDRWQWRPRRLNIGWLDGTHPFSVGDCPPEFLLALQYLTDRPIGHHRGYHQCELCHVPPLPYSRWTPLHDEILGNGMIAVADADGYTYMAPVLIRHYVRVHRYLPPPVFIDACCVAAKQEIDA